VENSLLGLLCVANQERLLLAPLIEAFATEHRGRIRDQLKRLAQRVRSGTSLIESLEQTRGVLSDEKLLQLRFAFHAGTIGDSLEALSHREADSANDMRLQFKRTLLAEGLNFLIVLIAASPIILYLVPTYLQLWSDIDIPATTSAKFLNSIPAFLTHYAGSILTAFVTLGLCMWLLKPMQWFRRRYASRWFSPIANLRSATLLRILSTSAIEGRPLPGSLSTLARYHYDANVRSKLLYARNEVEQGVEPWSSLSNTGILTPGETKALREASNSRVQSWLMLQFAHAKEDRVYQRVSILLSFVHPVMTLLFGIVVLLLGQLCIGGISRIVITLGTGG